MARIESLNPLARKMIQMLVATALAPALKQTDWKKKVGTVVFRIWRTYLTSSATSIGFVQARVTASIFCTPR